MSPANCHTHAWRVVGQPTTNALSLILLIEHAKDEVSERRETVNFVSVRTHRELEVLRKLECLESRECRVDVIEVECIEISLGG